MTRLSLLCSSDLFAPLCVENLVQVGRTSQGPPAQTTHKAIVLNPADLEVDVRVMLGDAGQKPSLGTHVKSKTSALQSDMSMAGTVSLSTTPVPRGGAIQSGGWVAQTTAASDSLYGSRGIVQASRVPDWFNMEDASVRPRVSRAHAVALDDDAVSLTPVVIPDPMWDEHLGSKLRDVSRHGDSPIDQSTRARRSQSISAQEEAGAMKETNVVAWESNLVEVVGSGSGSGFGSGSNIGVEGIPGSALLSGPEAGQGTVRTRVLHLNPQHRLYQGPQPMRSVKPLRSGAQLNAVVLPLLSVSSLCS